MFTISLSEAFVGDLGDKIKKPKVQDITNCLLAGAEKKGIACKRLTKHGVRQG